MGRRIGNYRTGKRGTGHRGRGPTKDPLEGRQDAGGPLGHTLLARRTAQAHVHILRVGQGTGQLETLVGRIGRKRAVGLPEDPKARRGRGKVKRIPRGDSGRLGRYQTGPTGQ